MRALDLETYPIGARITPRVVSAQQYTKGQGVIVTTREAFPEALDELEAYLERGGHIVGQNIPYDLACLCVERDSLLEVFFKALSNGQIHDTRIREQLIGIALGQFRSWRYSLDAMVGRYFGVTLTGKKGEDVWRVNFHKLDGVPAKSWPQEAYDYAADDAKWTLRVYEAQEALEAITDAGRPVMPLPDEREQTAASFVLHLLRVQGVKVDRPRAKAWIEQIEAEAKEHLKHALAGGFLRPNGTRDLSVMRDLVTEGYDGSPPLTEKGAVSTARDVLLGSGNPHLIAWAEGSKVQKLANTYASIVTDVDAVYPRYNTLRRTGRTSCQKPNMQQPPREGGFRELFIPRSGCFVLCDYDQIELLALGQILKWWTGTSAIADAVNAGRDLHVEVAATLDRTSYENMLKRVQEGEPKAKELRQFSKIANYGFGGGLSASSFCDYAQSFGLDIDPNKATEIRKAWLSAWPEMRQYFDKIGLATRQGPITITQEVSGRQRGGVNFTACCNGFFQALVADGAKAALVEVSRRCYTEPESSLFGARPCAFLHDEIILDQVPVERCHEVALELSSVMVEQMQKYIPDIKVSAEGYAATRWSKDAKRVTEDGRLVPWSP